MKRLTGRLLACIVLASIGCGGGSGSGSGGGKDAGAHEDGGQSSPKLALLGELPGDLGTGLFTMGNTGQTAGLAIFVGVTDEISNQNLSVIDVKSRSVKASYAFPPPSFYADSTGVAAIGDQILELAGSFNFPDGVYAAQLAESGAGPAQVVPTMDGCRQFTPIAGTSLVAATPCFEMFDSAKSFAYVAAFDGNDGDVKFLVASATTIAGVTSDPDDPDPAKGEVFLFDIEKKTATRSKITFDPMGWTSAAFSPDGATVYVDGGNEHIHVIDVATNTAKKSISVPPSADTQAGRRIAVSADGKYLFIGNREKVSLVAVDLSDGSLAADIGVTAPPRDTWVTADGTVVVTQDSGHLSFFSFE